MPNTDGQEGAGTSSTRVTVTPVWRVAARWGTLALGIALVAVCSFYWGGARAADIRARVGFVEEVKDLGEVRWGQQIRTTVEFENRTGEPVTIARVVSSCGCMLVDERGSIDGTVVAPGTSLPIEIVFNSGKTVTVKNAYVQLKTDDGKQYRTNVRAVVTGEWELSADRVDFGEVPLGSETSPSETVIFTSATDEFVGAPETNAAWLRCVLKPESPDGPIDRRRLVLSVIPGKLPPGKNVASVSFETTNKTVPLGRIYVNARGVTPLRPYPSHAVLHPGSGAVIRFTDSERNLAQLVSVESENPEVRARIIHPGQVKVMISESTRIEKKAARVVVRDKFGRTGTVFVSTIRE